MPVVLGPTLNQFASVITLSSVNRLDNSLKRFLILVDLKP